MAGGADRLSTLRAALAALAALAGPGTSLAHAAGPPQLGETWAGEVAATSARLHSTVNPNGLSTHYRFDFIATAAYEANLNEAKEGFAGAFVAPAGAEAALGFGTTAIAISQQLSGLASETAYRYRLVAHNSAGTVTSPTLGIVTHGFGGGALLLDGRGWEMVSPVEKNGGAVALPGMLAGGGVLQAAEDGDSVTYSSSASFGEGAEGAPPGSQYVASRSQGGWSSEDISTLLFSGSYGATPEGVPYRLFSPDLARAMLLNGEHCRGEGEGCGVANPPLVGTEAPTGYQDYYLRDNASGTFVALLTATNASIALSPARFDLAFAGASPDLRHVVLSTCAALTADAVEIPQGEGCDPSEQNLYEWSDGTIRLVNLLPGDSQGTPGASLATPGGAVSSDGSRVYFTDSGNLYLREGGHTVQVDEEEGGGGELQTATPDGAVAFFAKAGHVYRYEAQPKGPSTTDLTPAGGVKGVLGASEDGARLYYQDASGLKLWHAGASTTIAPGADVAAASDYPPATGTARVSADGTRLAFLSPVSPTGYDNTDQGTGEADSEVYLYDAGSGLVCVSCNPTEERPIGPSTIPGAIPNGEGTGATRSYKPRALSSDGRRLFFDSSDALVLADTDKAPDAYEWEAQGTGSCAKPGGCLALVSSGKGEGNAVFVDASGDGSDAFFVTPGSLVGPDPGSADLYDARIGGGFPEPPNPIPCEGDACQGLPSEPDETGVGTLVAGPGNPPVHYRRHLHRKHRKNRHRKGKRGRR